MPSRVCAISLVALVAISSCQAMWPLYMGMNQAQGGGQGFNQPSLLQAMTGALPCNPMQAHQRRPGPPGRGGPGGAGRGAPGQPGAPPAQSRMFNPFIGAMVDVPDAPDFPMMGATGLSACYCQNFESSCAAFGMFGDPVCSQFGLCCSCDMFFKR